MPNTNKSNWIALRLILTLVFLFSTFQSTGASQLNPGSRLSEAASQPEPGAQAFAADRLIVKLDPLAAQAFAFQPGDSLSSQALTNLAPGVQVSAARQLFKEDQSTQTDSTALEGIYLLELIPGSDVLQAAEAFAGNAAVEWAEPDYLAYPTTIPDDDYFADQWGLTQIDAPQAWDLSTGAANLTIAMIDSGVQFTHPDLTGKLWTNPGETAGNGLDDDNNGYIDDLHGWDFVNLDNDPADDNGHGTQTAGVAGAASNNGIGVAGVCWNCTLMPVKVMSAGGVANYSDIAAGVLYAARKGARVINISLGGYSESSALLAAIQSATETYNAVVVAGTGNDHLDTPFYPAAYPQVLAVAATGPGDVLWGESNYGDWVDLSAPGVNIHTTFLGGDYGSVDGTSLSTAFVSGVAGLLRSHYPDWSGEMVRAQLLHTAEDIDALNPGLSGLLGRGRVNAYQALSTTPQPLLSFEGQTVNGSATTRPEPGSSVELVVSLYNKWADASSVSATLSSSSAYVSVTTASAAYGEIPAYATAANPTPFMFTLSASAPYGADISLNLRVTASGGYVVNIPITVQTASAVVYVDSTINTQTWTNDRMYVINKASGIPAGSTLTIEPGTEIRFDGDFGLVVQGALIADGTPDQPIVFLATEPGQGYIQFADSSVDAIFDGDGDYLDGSILRFTILDKVRGVNISSAAPYIFGNSLLNNPGGIYGRGAAGLVISNNELINSPIDFEGSGIISSNHMDGSGISLWYGLFDVTSNRVTNCNVGISMVQETVVVSGNLLANNNIGLSIGDEVLMDSGNITASNNTIVSNKEVGVFIDGASPLIQHNNILHSGEGYALKNIVPNSEVASVDATQNWWGTTNPSEIDAAIYDSQDEFGLGTVNYTPFLTAPEPNAPAYVTDVEISPDTTLGIQTATFDLRFNREMDQTIAPIITFQSSRNNTWTTYTETNSGLPNYNVLAAEVAPDGAVWFGTWGGAGRFDGTTWTIYNTTNSGLPNDFISGFGFAPDGAIWISSASGGLVRFDGSVWTSYDFSNSGLPNLMVLDIEVAPDGSLWFGTWGGAVRYDGITWTVYNSSNSGLPNNSITNVAISMDGSVWFSLDNFSGVVRYYGDDWTIYDQTNSGLPESNILAIEIDPQGDVWFGTSAGVVKFDGINWIILNTSNSGLPNNVIKEIAFLPNSVVWFGINDYGAARFDGINWTVYNYSNSLLLSTDIQDISITPDGGVWFATNGSAYLFWDQPTYDTNSGHWQSTDTYRATLDITSLIPLDDYLISISGAVGTDGIEIVPVTDYPFTVDYAGAISDTTPPPAPAVEFCAGSTLTSLSATWSVIDPETAIDTYSYAIGTTPGGSEVVDWTSTTATSFSRTNLNLTAGQTYYVAVKARNAGGLWSVEGIPPGVVAGSGLCTTNIRSVFLPVVKLKP